MKYFKNAGNKLQANPDFSDFETSNGLISMKDFKDKYISIKPFQEYILILLCDKKIDFVEKYLNIEKHITKIAK